MVSSFKIPANGLIDVKALKPKVGDEILIEVRKLLRVNSLGQKFEVAINGHEGIFRVPVVD